MSAAARDLHHFILQLLDALREARLFSFSSASSATSPARISPRFQVTDVTANWLGQAIDVVGIRYEGVHLASQSQARQVGHGPGVNRTYDVAAFIAPGVRFGSHARQVRRFGDQESWTLSRLVAKQGVFSHPCAAFGGL